MPRLIVQSQEFSGKVYELTGPSLTVGRLPDNTLQIDHNSVSGHHAEMLLDERDYKVRDLDSTNGTRVNGERVSEQKLRRNDMVRFGNIELLYDSEYAAPAQALPEPSPRLNLNASHSQGRPANFVNASPFPKGIASMGNVWLFTFLGLGLLTLGALGYFIYTVLIASTGA